MKSLMWACAMALILAPGVDAKSLANAESNPSKNESVSPSANATVEAEGRKLGEFTTRQGFRRVYVLVPEGLSQEQIIAVAKAWHQREQDGWLWLIDDDSKFDLLLETLPQTEQGNLDNFPAEWIKNHAVANSSLVLFPDRTRRWLLMPGASRDATAPIAELPCINGKGQCTH